MKSYREPGFNDRIGAAAQAKQKALEKLRAKPPIDEALVAERREARLAREARGRDRAWWIGVLPLLVILSLFASRSGDEDVPSNIYTLY